MRATREQRRAAGNPATPADELAQLAMIPELQLSVALNPSAYDELLDWLAEHGTAEVRSILDPDGAEDPVEPEANPSDVLIEGPIWELDEASDEPIAPAPASGGIAPLAPRRAEAARTAQDHAAAREEADLAARAAEIRRWEAAYSRAHDGALPPPGYSPPIIVMPAGYREARTNGMAIAAFVLALVGVGLLGLIFGYTARAQIERTGEQGAGFALAAIVLGWIGVASAAALLIWYAYVWSLVGVAFQ